MNNVDGFTLEKVQQHHVSDSRILTLSRLMPTIVGMDSACLKKKIIARLSFEVSST